MEIVKENTARIDVHDKCIFFYFRIIHKILKNTQYSR